ncbi:MAG: response regulator transcription factor [Alphaproteobacteria bacterium]|nr:response regulator transcription factor [Alphaproteobacteria bacterium]
MKEKINIMIADKNPLVRRGLEGLCEDDGRFICRGSFDSGEAFIKAMLESGVRIGVIGWLLPDMRGDEVMQAFHAAGERKRIVVYTGSPHPGIPKRVMALGGFGYCSKSEPPEFLLDTIVDVSHGRISFPYVDVRSLYNDPFADLTNREKELLSALSQGWTNQQIAQRIGISDNTVKFHLKNLYEKLDVNNRAMAVALYMERRQDEH